MQGGDPRIIFDNPQRNNSFLRKLGQAYTLSNGVIVEVVNADQARIAEEAGAKAVLVTRHPSYIPLLIEVKQAVHIPVMAKVRQGNFGDAYLLEFDQLADFIEESMLLYPLNHLNKHNIDVPFACWGRNLGDVLNRMNEGATLIRIQGNEEDNMVIVDTMWKVREVMRRFRALQNMPDNDVFEFATEINAPPLLVARVKELGRLPVSLFASGGITDPVNAALMMHLGCDGVFVGNEVWQLPNPKGRVSAMAQAVIHYNNPNIMGNLNW